MTQRDDTAPRDWETTAMRYHDQATGYCLHVALGHSTGMWTWHITKDYAVLIVGEMGIQHATMGEAQAAALRWFEGQVHHER